MCGKYTCTMQMPEVNGSRKTREVGVGGGRLGRGPEVRDKVPNPECDFHRRTRFTSTEGEGEGVVPRDGGYSGW